MRLISSGGAPVLAPRANRSRRRQVEQPPDAEPELPRTRAGRGELGGRLPLQVLEELDALEMRVAECRHLRRVRVAVGLGPDRPAPRCAVLPAAVFLQRLEQGVLAQGVAVRRLERAERARPVAIARQVNVAEAGVQAFK